MLLQLEYTKFDGMTSGKEKIVDLADGLANHGHNIEDITDLSGQLAGVTGGLVYKTTWDPSTGELPPGGPGWYYVVNGSGTVGGVDYQPKDMILWNGSSWDKIDNTDSVTSVNGQVGAVTLTIPSGDYNDLTNKPDLSSLHTHTNHIDSYPDPNGATNGYVLKKTGTGLAFQPATDNFSGSYNDLTNKPDLTDLHTHTNKQWIDMVPHPGSAITGQVLKPTSSTTIGWGAVRWEDVASKPTMAPSNATANSSDAFLLERGNHTGVQPISTIDGLQTLLDNLNAGLSFQGDWDPSTEYPDGDDGHYWIVSAPGEVSGVDYMPRDWIVWNGTEWVKIDNTDRVKTVNGQEPDETGNIEVPSNSTTLQSETLTGLEAGETRIITSGLPVLAIVETVYTLEEV